MNTKTLKYSTVKPEAIELRRKGLTYSEITFKLGPIPKSTLNGWMKNIQLTEDQKLRISNKMKVAGHSGRLNGAWVNKQKRVDRLKLIEEEARKSYIINSKHPLFLAGLVLYLAEGTKKTEAFMFMNSDYKLMLLMMHWAELFGDLNKDDMKFRLYIHELYAHEKCENYWEKALEIKKEQFQKTSYKPNIRAYKKNPAYKGCMRLEVKGSVLYWKTIFWRDCFYEGIKA